MAGVTARGCSPSCIANAYSLWPGMPEGRRGGRPSERLEMRSSACLRVQATGRVRCKSQARSDLTREIGWGIGSGLMIAANLLR